MTLERDANYKLGYTTLVQSINTIRDEAFVQLQRRTLRECLDDALNEAAAVLYPGTPGDGHDH